MEPADTVTRNQRTVENGTTVARWVVVRQYRGTATLFVTFRDENEAEVTDVSDPVFKTSHRNALEYMRVNWKRYQVEVDGFQIERGVSWGRLERRQRA